MTSILALNIGSSSLKAAAFEPGSEGPRCWLSASYDASRGEDHVQIRSAGHESLLDVPGKDLVGAACRLLELTEERNDRRVVVGHRIVHGGTLSGAPTWLSQDSVARLDALRGLAPLHQSANLAPAKALLRDRPDIQQVACFDTTFHETMPPVARLLPLPKDSPAQGLRRYGFHGLSYSSVARRMAQHGFGRIVALHLGGGASVCAMKDGRSIDTTMGTTPLAGPMMTSRAGSVDPGVLLYLMKRGCDADTLERMLWKDSGLKGVSGISSDLRDLIGCDDPVAEAAVDLFCTDLVRYVGAMAARLGGMDALIFTGGAGAGQPLVRQKVAAAFGWAGVTLDPHANAGVDEDSVAAKGSVISHADSAVQVWVLPVEEEAEIAREVTRFMEDEA